MSNSFTISVEFSYKGETFNLSTRVDLDAYLEQGSEIPMLHDLIARANKIDHYSYQYEVLCSEDIHFSEVQGFAGDYIVDGVFDAVGFAGHWHEHHVEHIVAAIAQREMGVAELASQPDLQRALLAAYRAGEAGSRRGQE